LQGNWREEHVLALRLGLASWQHYQAQQRELEEVIARQLRQLKKAQDLPPLPPKPRQRGRTANEPRFDVRTALYYVTGVDLTALDGIAEVTALVVVSEIGLDMSRFPTVKHFCAWLGLCPLPTAEKVGRTGIVESDTPRQRPRGTRLVPGGTVVMA
jgi:transposase